MRGRRLVEIVELDVITARVVIAAGEPGVIRDIDAARAQIAAHVGAVCHGREEPGVGTAAASATRSAIVRGFVWIVEARRSMAEDEHDARETAGEAGGAED